MKKVRLGKTMKIVWGILTNGAEVPLGGRDLTLFMNTPNNTKIQMPFTIENGNYLAFTFEGKDQKTLGAYSLTLWENYGKEGQTAVDRSNAFVLVRTTDEEI